MRKTAGIVLAFAATLGLSGSIAYGQAVISARAGLVHYIEGDVFIGDHAVEERSTVYDQVVKEGEIMRTEEGRAEVLLNPGVFLRLRENSAFKMLSSKLTDTRVEALSGSVLLEVGELPKDTNLQIVYKDEKIELAKSGLYRVDCEDGTFRVYTGEAMVDRASGTFTVKGGKFVSLSSKVLTASNFDSKVGDEFYRWAARRASYLSMANIASAKEAHDSGMTSTSGQWVFNPWYNMYTYMPYRSWYNSPFGFGFWSASAWPSYWGGYYGGYYPGYYNGGGWGGGGGAASTSTRMSSSSGMGDISRPSSGGGWGGVSGSSSGGVSGGGVSSGGVSSGGASSGGGRGGGGGGGAPASGGTRGH